MRTVSAHYHASGNPFLDHSAWVEETSLLEKEREGEKRRDASLQNIPDDCSFEAGVKEADCWRGLEMKTSSSHHSPVLGTGVFGQVRNMDNSTHHLIRESSQNPDSKLSPRCKALAETTDVFAVKWAKSDGKPRSTRGMVAGSGDVVKEACAHKRLSRQTSVVPCFFKAWECAGESYMVMEVLRMTLDEATERAHPKNLKLSFSLRLAQAIVGAIEQVTQAGCRHGDLHLNNLMFDFEGRVRLVDFGSTTCGEEEEVGESEHDESEAKREVVFRDLNRALCRHFWKDAFVSPESQESFRWLKEICEKSPSYVFGTYAKHAEEPALTSEELEAIAAVISSFQTHLINQHGLTITSDKHVQLLQERQEKRSEGAGGSKQPDVRTFFPTKDEAEAVVAPYAETHEKRIKCDTLTTDFLASAGWPHLTENEALRKLVKALDPRYDLPSVGKVQRLLLPTLKNKIILSIKDRLRKAATRRVSIILDIWLHSGKSGFLAITIHWLTENFEMDSTSFLDPEMTIYHGAEQIGEMVRKVLNLLGISLEEVLAATSDRERNVVNAVELLGLP
uniref:Protein kinase domain-containing protein n=1 Tax=Chromera velia CCMP2878 TaxID=1169474 RepID=A0A0G4IB63_9ALVE|eukprot:Cvel_12746.t1-p1 / transcript=Cvel_12746.t1 / gene=Cvel_12746 / organism=Chromera_velia_CCMP2878 / gene_product=hypothetical protein / transcript_product=hypothetical protein / location=Cvel_scaffold847:14021-20142(+) / protein_length=562 / sequence_SO=supercontig / SO=protein_coding / is_pseudo=false